MTESNCMEIGHLHLECGEDLCEQWQNAGGLLAAQALSPLAAIEPAKIKHLTMLAVGTGAAIAGLAGLKLGFKQIDLVLHPDDAESFKKLDLEQKANLYDRIEAVPVGRNYLRVLMGCDGLVPPIKQGAELVNRLRRDGQFVLFGLPKESISETFSVFSKNGLSLRASGINGEQGFLAGSLAN